MSFQLTNNAHSTLASGVSNVATTMVVATGEGALFPTPAGGDVFRATLVRASDSAIEVVEVTARTSDTMTVTRAQEGTTGLTLLAGDKFELRVTAAVLDAKAGKATANVWTAIQTFTNSMLKLLGSSTGKTTFTSANSSATDYTITIPAVTDTLAVLGANTFTGNQAHGDNQVSRAMLIDCGNTVVAKGNSGTSTQTYDYTAGSVQTSTATGNHTLATSNWPPTGNLGVILILLTNGGAYTLTWPTVNWIKPDGTTTTSVSTYLSALSGRAAFQTSGMDQVMLWSQDAGTTIYGKLV